MYFLFIERIATLGAECEGCIIPIATRQDKLERFQFDGQVDKYVSVVTLFVLLFERNY
jgi:hypothetical protein